MAALLAMVASASDASEFITCPRGLDSFGGGAVHIDHLGKNWLMFLPRQSEMRLTDKYIDCRYQGATTVILERPNKGCVLGAEGGAISTQPDMKTCTYIGDANKRTPRHCYVACP